MSLNETLQLSLISLKERCLKQQKKIEDLERDNDRLRLVAARSHESLSGDSGDQDVVRQLEEANLQLRQRNLELTQALLRKESKSDPEVSWNSAGGMETDVDGDDDDDEDEEAVMEKLRVADRHTGELKHVLLDQQKALATILDKFRDHHESLMAENARAAAPEVDRLCPMCEGRFPEDEMSMEEFESHVMDHFSYEDRSLDVAEHYDMMLDAQGRLDGEFG